MSVKIHIVLDDDLASRLKALAQQEDRSFSRQVAFMLKRTMGEAPTNSNLPTHVEVPDTAPEPEDPWWEKPNG